MLAKRRASAERQKGTGCIGETEKKSVALISGRSGNDWGTEGASAGHKWDAVLLTPAWGGQPATFTLSSFFLSQTPTIVQDACKR